jgi:hypothetical protein
MYTDSRLDTDRVFSHALNTVNKIRTGSQKPPSATRLKLYGLYKQAMGMTPLYLSAINRSSDKYRGRCRRNNGKARGKRG